MFAEMTKWAWPLVVLAACSPDVVRRQTERDPAALRPFCFTATLDLEKGTASVAPPSKRDDASQPRFLDDRQLELTLDGLASTPAGDGTRVTARLALRNLTTTNLGAQSLALAPPSARGLIVYDCGVSGLDASGGSVPARTGPGFDGDGASATGAPFDFVYGLSCSSPEACSRYEVFPAPLAPTATTRPRSIDLETTTSARTLEVRLGVLGAPDDVETGPVSGRVLVRGAGPLEGAVVSITPAGLMNTTPASGTFSFSAVARGVQTLQATAADCTPVELKVVSPQSDLTLELDCSERRGRLEGQVRLVDGGVVSGVPIAVLPEGGSVLRAITDADGRYRVDEVPIGATGTGEAVIVELPPGVKGPAPVRYQDLFAGAVARADFILAPLDPAQAYELISTWGPVQNGQVKLFLRADLTNLNVPEINGVGADAMVGIAVRSVLVRGERLRYRNGRVAPGAGFTIGAVNGATWPGQVYSAAGAITNLYGVRPLFEYEFDVLPGPPAITRTFTKDIELLVDNGTRPIDLMRRVRVIEGTLVLP